MTEEPYDTIIIGGGPAAASAAVYGGRKKMRSLVITEQFGGQSVVSSGIENWIGEKQITGVDLAEKLEEHVRAQNTVEVKAGEKVTQVKAGSGCAFDVWTDKQGRYQSKTLIVASGARRRRLSVPGEDEFDGRGVAYCATCDAPFFQDQDVAVVGSGNSAMETIIDLLSYAKKIYLLWRDPIDADPVNEEKVRGAEKVQIIGSTEIKAILGNQSVTGVRYRATDSGEESEVSVQGVFVEIGAIPNSEFAEDLVETNKDGEIVVDPLTGETSREGIFAAGDVTQDPFKQNNIAAGDGVRAALSAYYYLLKMKKHSPCAEGWG
jgi:alkyl hydroperoxide reductase subunit F